MCRIAAVRFWGDFHGQLSMVLNALYEASCSDPYLARITGGDGRHCHGFGYVAALLSNGSWEVIHGRFDAYPSVGDEDKACEINLSRFKQALGKLLRLSENVDEGVFVIHSRRTRNEPRGVTAAHPFKEEITVKLGDGFSVVDFYLSHNGGVDKSGIVYAIGVKDSSIYTDSHLYHKLLASRLDGVDFNDIPSKLAEVIAGSLSYVKSALDLCMLFTPSHGSPMLSAVGYIRNKDDGNRFRYYEPFIFKEGNISGYVSSTVKDILAGRGFFKNPVENIYGRLAVIGRGEVEVIPIPGA